MELITDAAAMRERVRDVHRQRKRVALVMTMGALHEGHLSLVRLAREQGDLVVLSIFVNPIQFNSSQDLARYPRTLEADIEKSAEAGVDVVFAPTADQIFPWAEDLSRGASAVTAGASRPCRILAGARSEGLCGGSRPGHFDGVATVVGIFFNIIRPDAAVFGEKDYQQVAVIEQMVGDLHFGLTIIRGKTIRDSDGLALSSRNALLTADERYHALFIPQTLQKIAALARDGERHAPALRALVLENLERPGGLRVDYVEIVTPDDLRTVVGDIDGEAQLLVAAFAGSVRLIDNIRLVVPPRNKA